MRQRDSWKVHTLPVLFCNHVFMTSFIHLFIQRIFTEGL